VRVAEWSDAYASEVENWHYDPPYDFYDSASDPADAAEMRDPAQREHFRALLDDEGALEAFWHFAWREDVVEIGLGLRPDLTGHGFGERYVEAELDYAREWWSPQTFRLYVTAWNARAIRLYERLGFHEVGRETRSFPDRGENEFLRMERPA
jgi:[ribosomal protein S18]-alanine N-acetyltransferase